jgi:probable HAF family extracellular repeat protein
VIHAFHWHDGSFVDLGTMGGPDSHALAINDAGVIAGYARDEAGIAHAVLWEKGKLKLLSPVSAAFPRSQALAISESGVAVGSLYNERAGHAMIWNDPKIARLEPHEGERASIATAINDEGDVAGDVTLDEKDYHPHACLWKRGVPKLLESLGFASTASAINAAGHLVGSYFRDKGESRAFVWEGKRMHDLTCLLESAGDVVLRSAMMIDDRGWIVGGGEHKGLPMAFVARPR